MRFSTGSVWPCQREKRAGFDKPETVPADSLTDTNPIQSHHTDVSLAHFHLWSEHLISSLLLAERPEYKSFINTRRDALHNRFWGLTLYIYLCVGEYLEACSEGLSRKFLRWLYRRPGLIVTLFAFFSISLSFKMPVHAQILSSESYWTFPHPQNPVAGQVVTPWGMLSQSANYVLLKLKL